MKKQILLFALLSLGLSVFAKDIKTVVVTTNPQMHCESCEKKIKDGIKFEKGVKEIVTSVPDQTVTIKYDADKTTTDKLFKAFGEVGYEVKVVGDCAKDAKEGCKSATKCSSDKKCCKAGKEGCKSGKSCHSEK